MAMIIVSLLGAAAGAVVAAAAGAVVAAAAGAVVAAAAGAVVAAAAGAVVAAGATVAVGAEAAGADVAAGLAAVDTVAAGAAVGAAGAGAEHAVASKTRDATSPVELLTPVLLSPVRSQRLAQATPPRRGAQDTLFFVRCHPPVRLLDCALVPSMIIDAHCHVGGAAERRGSPAEMLSVMDRLGVDVGFAMPAPGLRPDNDGLAELIRPHPDRFVGVAWINPNTGSDALRDLERAATQHGFRGIKLQPILHAFSPMQAHVRQVVDLAAQLGLVVIVHTGDAPYALPWEVGELAARYPSTTFSMAHMGLTVMTYVEAAIRVAAGLNNVVLETAGMNFFRKIRDAVQTIGPERVLWGSDAPVLNQATEMQKVRDAGLTPEQEALVLGGNLARILGMREPQTASRG
jgi:predicted TIM-barrel fold metal-dependent hydrolase